MNIFGRKSAGRASARPAHIGVQLGRAFSSAYPALGEWPRSYEAQVREGYLSNVIAQRAVRMVAEGVASVPFSGSDPAAVALVTTTSAGQSLLETVAIHLLLHGNGYVQLLSGDDGIPCELYALRPERIAVEADARGWPSGFLYKAGSAATRLSPDELIHIRTHHPLDDHYGLGCLGAASGPIAIHNAATKWNKALLDNAARPSGALVYEPGEAGTTLSPEQFDRLKAEMEASFSGAPNAGRPMLLEGGLRWQSMSLSPTDMDFIALKSGAARDIALAFGVPPMLLGLPGDATYANYREANKALWRSGVLPLAGKMLAALAQGLRPWFPGLEFAVDYDAIGALAEDRERLWVQLSAAEFLTLDEKRELAGFAALGGEDVPESEAESGEPEAEAGNDEEPAPDPDPESEPPTEVKYNHNHNKFGQFTFAGQGLPSGGGSFGSGGTSAMAKPPAKTKLPPGPRTVSGRVSVRSNGRPIQTGDGRMIDNVATASFDRPDRISVTATSQPIRASNGTTIINRATASFDDPDFPRVSAAGRKLITESEDFRGEPYVPGKLANSGVTIGYGYDLGSRSSTGAKAELTAVGLEEHVAEALAGGAGLKGDKAVAFIRDSKTAIAMTEGQARSLFDIEARQHSVEVLRAINRPLTQNQFDALVSLHYNYPRAVRERLAELVNSGKIADAADEFDKYIYGTVKDGKTGKKVKVVLDGLVTRRAAEKRLFLGE
jgi:HK97 family phage portal protein